MESEVVKIALLSDDPIYIRKLRKFLKDHYPGRELAVFGHDEGCRDYSLAALFPALIEKKMISLLIIDFDKNYQYKRDLLKIINKYHFLKAIPRVGVFGEVHHNSDLLEAYSLGALLCDYKRDDLEDFVFNLKFLEKRETAGAPSYARAEGHGTVLWAKFLCSISDISLEEVSTLTKINKISPDKKWLEEFLPSFSTPRSFVNETDEVKKKFSWIEDINTLNFITEHPEIFMCDKLNVKNLEKSKIDERFNSLRVEKRIELDREEEILNEIKSNFSKYKQHPIKDKTRIMIIDKKMRLMEGVSERYQDLEYNLFNYPYMLEDFKIIKKVLPEILIVQQDAFEIVNAKGEILEMSLKEKLERLVKQLNESFEEPPILIVFNRKKKFECELKYSMSFEGEGSVDLLEKLGKIYQRKISPEWKAALRWDSEEDKISSDEIDLIGLKRTIMIEIPIVLKTISEHMVEVKTPMTLNDGAVLFIDNVNPFYISVFKELSEKDVCKGIVNGIDETYKMKVRRLVNDLIKLPKVKEDELEKQKYHQLNIDKFMEKIKAGMRKVDEIA